MCEGIEKLESLFLGVNREIVGKFLGIRSSLGGLFVILRQQGESLEGGNRVPVWNQIGQ